MPVHKKIAKLGKTVGKAAVRSLKRSARIAFKLKRKGVAKKRVKSFLKKRLRPASPVIKTPRRRRRAGRQ